MKLSDMRALLAEHDLQLTKSLGQHFLHDANQLRRIVALAELAPGDRVLEIGPGLGPLTEVLLAAGARVVAIERDERLLAILRERLGGDAHLELVHADARDFLRTNGGDWAGSKIVANLPYSVGSTLLLELAAAPCPPERLVVTLQREVVERLLAGPRDGAYGPLTLHVGLRFQPGHWFPIPTSCFFPTPKVDSACVRLDRRATELLPLGLHARFGEIVRQAFSQRRKMMLKVLRRHWPGAVLDAAFAVAGLAGNTRAEAVSLEQYVELTRQLEHAAPNGESV